MSEGASGRWIAASMAKATQRPSENGRNLLPNRLLEPWKNARTLRLTRPTRGFRILATWSGYWHWPGQAPSELCPSPDGNHFSPM
jgi:hypothetical protein